MIIFKYMALAATTLALLALGACTKEPIEGIDPNPNADQGTALTFTLPDALDGFSEGGAQTRAVGGFDPAARKWQEGDEVLAEITLNFNPIIYYIHTTLTYTASNTWTIAATDDLLVVIDIGTGGKTVTRNSGGNQMLKAHGGKVYLVVPDELKSKSGLHLATTLYYAPGMEWGVVNINNSNDVKPKLKSETPAGTVQLWSKSKGVTYFNPNNKEEFAAACAAVTTFTGDLLEARSPRLRIYTGRVGDKVKITTTNSFVPAAGDQTHDHTATTDAVGNAYFYGYSYSIFDGTDDKTFVVSLTNLRDAATGAAAPVTIFEASATNLVKLDHTCFGKSFAIDGAWAVAGTQGPIDVRTADGFITPAELTAMMGKVKGDPATKIARYTILGMDAAEAADPNHALLLLRAMNTYINARPAGYTAHVSLPDATVIGNYAFQSCAKLAAIDAPNATTLGNDAFWHCDALTNIDLPKATKLGGWVFEGCTKLTTIRLTQPGAWVSVHEKLFDYFNPAAPCTVTLAPGSYNAVGPNDAGGKSTWSPKSADGNTIRTFTQGGLNVSNNITFTVSAVAP